MNQIEYIGNFKGETNENEEDLVVESAPNTQISKCPITQKKINDPFKNPACNHVYEREAILSYVKGSKKGLTIF